MDHSKNYTSFVGKYIYGQRNVRHNIQEILTVKPTAGGGGEENVCLYINIHN